MPHLPALLRASKSHADSRVTYVELFYDLVFVFAITQLSHSLLHHFTGKGLAETAFLTVAVWWSWIYTSWATNWLNPQSTPVRILLFVLMAAGLVMSASIPEAFGEKGATFALAIVFMQILRVFFMLSALKGHSPANHRNFQRILVWSCLSGVFWIAGGFLEPEGRGLLWGTALAIDAIAPAAAFFVPGMGRSQTADWDVSPAHFAERCALFVIIALGESLLVTGATFAELDWTPLTLGAFAVCFIGTLAMWWVYFGVAAEDAGEEFNRSTDAGRLARSAYTYFHLPIVAGIILSAVSDEFVLAHPDHAATSFQAVAILGGPALFLLGNLLFKRTVFGVFVRSHMVGLVLLAALVFVTSAIPAIALAALAAAVMIVVGVWESVTVGRWHKANPDWRGALGEHHESH